MAQRVDYAVFPGVREDAFIATINKIIGHVRRSSLGAREFREWMKDEGLWNKDDAAHLTSFIDVHTDGQARLGPFAERMFAAPDEDAARELLYKRLVDENTLLVKYVLESLDIEGGGRLHSTYELHRMLTSYVYPGKHVGLVPFQNWIKWIVASGRVKLIGIRWGLTDLGKQAVPRLRSIDADEFLEDEAADEAARTAAAAQPAAPVAAPAVPVPAPAPVAPAVAVPTPAPAPRTARAAKPTPALAEVGPDGEEFLDLPPEPEPVDDTVFQKYEAQFDTPDAPAPQARPTAAPAAGRAAAVSHAPATGAAAMANAPVEVATPGLALPRHTATLPKVLRQIQAEAACTCQPLEVAEVIAALRDYGRGRGLGGGSLLLAHGLEARMAANEAARHLMLASLLARLYAARPDGSLAELLVERVGGLAPVAVLLDRPEALAEVVVRWGLAQGDPASTAVRSALFETVLGGRALKAQADLPTVLAEAPSSEILVGMLGQGLMRAASVPAQLWLVREMVRVGLWTRPAATEIAFVPTRPVRLMAYRLRLIDSHFAQGAAMLMQVARRLCPILPPGSVEAAAFEELALSDHLRFDCVRVPICQQPCALAPTHGESF